MLEEMSLESGLNRWVRRMKVSESGMWRWD